MLKLHDWFINICNKAKQTDEEAIIDFNGDPNICYDSLLRMIPFSSQLLQMQQIIFDKIDQSANPLSFHTQYRVRESVDSEKVTYTLKFQLFCHVNSHDCIGPITLALNDQYKML